MKTSFPCLLILLSFAPGVARAQDTQEEQLFTTLSEKTLHKLLGQMKIPFDRKEDEIKGKKVVSYLLTLKDGHKAILINGRGFLSVWALGFKTLNNEDISLERVNEWNLRNPLSTALVDRNGYGVLIAALITQGGTNQKIIQEWLSQYSLALAQFAKYTR
jgi:hypothetical protein